MRLRTDVETGQYGLTNSFETSYVKSLTQRKLRLLLIQRKPQFPAVTEIPTTSGKDTRVLMDLQYILRLVSSQI